MKKNNKEASIGYILLWIILIIITFLIMFVFPEKTEIFLLNILNIFRFIILIKPIYIFLSIIIILLIIILIKINNNK